MASATCSARMSDDCARSAIVRATRAIRSSSRAENCRFRTGMRKVASELGQFVKKQYAVMRQTDLAGFCERPAVSKPLDKWTPALIFPR